MKHGMPSALKAFGAVLLLTVFLCFIPLHVEGWNKTSNAICDAGHFPLFAIVAFVASILFFRSAFGPQGNSGRSALYGALVSIFLAALIEVIQPFFGRSEQLDDLLTGGFGAIYGAGAAGVFLSQKSPRLIGLYLSALLPISLFLLSGVPRAFSADSYRRSSFPMLGDFEDWRELVFWSTDKNTPSKAAPMPAETHSTSGKFSLRIKGQNSTWTSAEYAAGRQDWSGFAELRFNAYNPGEAFELLVRVDDDEDCREVGSRFNIRVPLKAGASRFGIPLEKIRSGPKTRTLNTDKIKTLIFAIPPSDGRSKEVYLDEVKLVLP